ncbi:MAG: YraN family protein, partial [Pseudonocardiaceae bacterium]
MAGDPRNGLGALGERLAGEHLERAGYEILERNFRCRAGELDLVAASERALVFCEVKTRVAGGRSGPAGPLDAIGPGKRRRVRLLAGEWLDLHRGDRLYRATLRF